LKALLLLLFFCPGQKRGTSFASSQQIARLAVSLGGQFFLSQQKINFAFGLQRHVFMQMLSMGFFSLAHDQSLMQKSDAGHCGFYFRFFVQIKWKCVRK
jgi:hypothetical protein